MKALQITAPGAAALVDVPEPSAKPGQALVRIEAVTTCPQWDLHIMGGDPMFPGDELHYPYVAGQPGHEAVGVVVDTGDGVTSLRRGDRVAMWRDSDHLNLGCYAEYVARPAEDMLVVPKDLPAEKLAPMELAMCVRISFEQLEQVGGVGGRRVGISGIGAAGLVAIQMARAGGATEVVAFDLHESRRTLALQAGADAAVDPRQAPEIDRLGPDALDCAIDCAGQAASVQFLMDRTIHAVALFGVLRGDVTFGWKHWAHLALLGYRPHHRGAAEAALQHVLRGELDLSALVSARLPLAEYGRGVEMLRRQEAVKVCFVP
jgi:threonine dehydrogenase-like Zn-dependent dehydrogenase